MFIFDPTYFLIIAPALILSIYAQAKVSSTFRKFSKVSSVNRYSGVKAARAILDSNGLNDVEVEEIPGQLTDHYDPRDKTLRLSTDVYGGRSLSALGVAAHEAGHALQDAAAYGTSANTKFDRPCRQFRFKWSRLLIHNRFLCSRHPFSLFNEFSNNFLFSRSFLLSHHTSRRV